MAVATPITESALLERIIGQEFGTLSEDAAQSLLNLRFPSDDSKRIRRLLRKNNLGTISAAERLALEKYLRIGQFIDLVHARVRLTLAKRSRTK